MVGASTRRSRSWSVCLSWLGDGEFDLILRLENAGVELVVVFAALAGEEEFLDRMP
jgi:hypothetical protein